MPDSDTFIALFKACSTIGDVKTAFNGIIQLKQLNIPLSSYMYNGLLRTYAGACSLELVTQELRDLYSKDAWKLFKELQTTDKIPVNINILNSLLLVHTKAHDLAQVEGAVLPLYEKYNIKPDPFTYQHLMEMYSEKREFKALLKVFENMKKANSTPTFFALNYYLDTAIRLEDTDMIVDALKEFKKINREPKRYYLVKLGNAQDMPDRVYLELIEFKERFGFAKEGVKRSRPKDKYLTM